MAALIVIIVGYVEAQLLALSEEFLNIWRDAEEHHLYENIDNDRENVNEKYDSINKQVSVKLRTLIIRHTTVLNLFLQVEIIFRNVFAFEFLILSVGLIGAMLGGLERTYLDVSYILIEVYLDCLIGQRVIDACGVFENAVYGCNWERFNASNMKTVLIVLSNAQKTLALSTGGIASLSFSTLMTVLKSVYSAFTTLRSVM